MFPPHKKQTDSIAQSDRISINFQRRIKQLSKKHFAWFITGLRWIIALVFIYAGITKILNPVSFAQDIDNYRILPYFLVTVLAMILPWLEILCGFLLIIGRLQHGAMLVLLSLTAIFLIAIISAVFRGLDISCGCFSSTAEGNTLGYTRLAQEVVFFAAISVVYFFSKDK